MDAYIKFYARVSPDTAIQLQRTMEQLMKDGMSTLHLLLSTPGGSVHDGISMYNLLKGLSIDVYTYNFGIVDSIGVVVFCAGNKRYSVPHARFLLHPVTIELTEGTTFDEPSLEEKLKLVKADQSNIAKVVSATIKQPIDDVLSLIYNRTTMEPEEALQAGLINEIKSDLVPAGQPLHSIFDK
jgi:ATP-dependent Clp protease, protease subunit